MRRSTRESTGTTDKTNINSRRALRIHPNGHYARSTDSRSVIPSKLGAFMPTKTIGDVVSYHFAYLLSLSSVSRDNAEPVPGVNSPARA